MTYSLPNYSRDSSIFDLYDLLKGYYFGQGDPIYSVISMRDPSNIGQDEMEAIANELSRIFSGKYDSATGEDVIVASDWLPTITELLNGERACPGCGDIICGVEYCEDCKKEIDS